MNRIVLDQDDITKLLVAGVLDTGQAYIVLHIDVPLKYAIQEALAAGNDEMDIARRYMVDPALVRYVALHGEQE